MIGFPSPPNGMSLETNWHETSKPHGGSPHKNKRTIACSFVTNTPLNIMSFHWLKAIAAADGPLAGPTFHRNNGASFPLEWAPLPGRKSPRNGRRCECFLTSPTFSEILDASCKLKIRLFMARPGRPCPGPLTSRKNVNRKLLQQIGKRKFHQPASF